MTSAVLPDHFCSPEPERITLTHITGISCHVADCTKKPPNLPPWLRSCWSFSSPSTVLVRRQHLPTPLPTHSAWGQVAHAVQSHWIFWTALQEQSSAGTSIIHSQYDPTAWPYLQDVPLASKHLWVLPAPQFPKDPTVVPISSWRGEQRKDRAWIYCLLQTAAKSSLTGVFSGCI